MPIRKEVTFEKMRAAIAAEELKRYCQNTKLCNNCIFSRANGDCTLSREAYAPCDWRFNFCLEKEKIGGGEE